MAYKVVQFMSYNPIGTVLHRVWPMQALAALPEFCVIAVHDLSPYRYGLAFQADLLILDTVFDAELVPIVLWRKAQGKPTIYDLRDHIFEAEPWNPEFYISNDPAMQAECIQMMGLVDLVQTTTPFLAEVFKPYSSRVVPFPNHLISAPQTIPEKPPSPLVIAWGGSPGHLCDMARIAPALSRWIAAHAGVQLAIMGDPTVAQLFTVPREKMRFVPISTMDAYERFLKEAHIALAPLRDTPFNCSRSDVKWLEYAANGCVFVGQRLSTYTGSVEEGKTGFLFDDTAELLRTLDRLYEDRALLDSVRRAAFDHVTRTRLHEHHVQERAALYRELLQRKSPQAGQGNTLDRQSRFPTVKLPDPPQGYLLLQPGPDEEKALIEVTGPRGHFSEAPIQMLEKRYGEFHLTAQVRGRLALARRDPVSAEQHLRRSLSFYPGAVRSHYLLANALAVMGRLGEAREALSQALQWNPGFVAAYRFLTALAEQQSERRGAPGAPWGAGSPSDWPGAISVCEAWERECHQDPWARARKALAMLRSGETQQGLALMAEAMGRVKERFKNWQLPFAAELVQIFRQADPPLARNPEWGDLILKAAEIFPHSLWLASRAGEICFHRGDHARGGQILQRARARLLAFEWQTTEGGAPPEYRQMIELYRQACEENGGVQGSGTAAAATDS